MILIKKAQKEDLEEILKLQYLAYQSEAKLFGNMDIPPLKQTIEEVYDEFQKGAILKAVDNGGVRYGKERIQSSIDLVAGIKDMKFQTILDVGCGTG